MKLAILIHLAIFAIFNSATSCKTIPETIVAMHRSLRINHQFLLFPSPTADALTLLNDPIFQQSFISTTIFNLDRSTKQFNMPSTYGQLFIIIMSSNSRSNLRILFQLNDLLANHRNPSMCFIFSNKIANIHSHLRKISTWCWKRSMLNVLFIVRDRDDGTHKFTYSPFSSFRLQPLSGGDEFYGNKMHNINRYPISFQYERSTNRSGDCFKRYMSRDAKLITLLAKQINGTPVEIDDIQKRAEIRVTRMPALNAVLTESRSLLYPMLMDKFCIVVPSASPLPLHLNYFLAFHAEVWASCFLSLAATLLMLLFVNRRRRQALFSELVHLIQLLANAPAFLDYSKLLLAEVFVLIPWTFGGVIVANMYLSALTSLTAHPFRP